jgi:hypothetical protein
MNLGKLLDNAAFWENGIYADNFALSKQDSKVSIQSEWEIRNAPIAVDFKISKLRLLAACSKKRFTT